MSSSPVYGDSDNVLLRKICLNLSDRAGGVKPPRYGDSKSRLLFKIAYLLYNFGL